MAATPAWMPTFGYLGQLPGDETVRTYQVTASLPSETKEIQVYAYISVQELEPSFKRGYYAVYTESTDGAQRFTCYMNIANVNDTVLNSDNFWLPYGEGIKPAVYMQLVSAEGSQGLKTKKPLRKNPKGDMKEHVNQRDDEPDQVYGEAYVTGYRVRS